MRELRMSNWLVILVLMGVAQGFSAPGQEVQPRPAPSTQTPRSTLANAPNEAALSPVTLEVIKLLQAGMSKSIIQAYIEQAAVTRALTAADLVALKEKGVPDDLTVALLKRANAVAAAQTRRPQLAATTGSTSSGQGAPPALGAPGSRVMDPESYDFWWYHYAYPRALAAANERLFSSYAPFYQSPPDAGYYYPPLGFAPQPFSRRTAPP